MRATNYKLWVLCVVALLIGTNAWANWQAYKHIQLRASDGNHFRLSCRGSSEVRAWFILARKIPGAFQKRFALYQVDNNPVRDLNEVKGTAADKNGDHSLRWPISNSLDPPSESLREIVEGKEITFQYYLPDGMIKETTFQLEGIQQAIKELVNADNR